jgi:GT2 family glycosyltransferase
MISVVVCSRNPDGSDRHVKNIGRTIGVEHEYIPIDNSARTYSLCGAYNHGLDRSTGDIVVFVHEDVFFLGQNWGAILANKFRADAALGMIGVAGGQYLHAQAPGWCVCGRPFIHGKVVHESEGRAILSVYSRVKGDVEVVALDGLFFAARRSIFEKIRFDDVTFDGFHFYDLDICMQARKAGYRLVVTEDILVKHLSGGSFDNVWVRYAQRFTRKYSSDFPVNCTSLVPDPEKKERFESFDVTGKMPGILAV